MGEWKETTLADLCTDISYGYTESAKQEKVGPKFLRITDIASGRLEWENVPYCTVNNSDFEKYKLLPGDIVIARTGATTGANYTIKETDPKDVVFASYLIRYKIDPQIANPFYVGQLLRSPSWSDYVEAIAGGSAQPGANAKQLGSYEILLPSLPEQRSIASILSSLDDKIDLLHRQNATLQKMAETLFRQWFVEEAKEEWEVVKIKDFDVFVTDYVANGSFASLAENVIYKLEPDYAILIRLKDFNSDFKGDFVYVNQHAYNFLNKSKLFGGEIIISNVGEYSGTVFKCPKLNRPMTLGPNSIVLISNYNNFFYLFFRSDYGKFLLDGIISGSAQPKFNKTSFRELEISYPSMEYIIEFEQMIKPYFDKIDFNQTQIRTLTSLRDTLLPKLMSGEIRIEPT